jgi:hypothetical protein
MIGQVTVFSSPSLLAKTWKLVDDKAVKDTAAQMTSGSYKTLNFSTVDELADILRSVTTRQALCASVALDGSESGTVTTQARVSSDPSAKTRTKGCFGLPAGAGIGFIDCDEAGITRDRLFGMLFDAVPALRGAAMLWRPSGSSHVFQGDADLTALRGQHVVIPVTDASDWARTLKVIAGRLWLQGHGRIKVSSAGSLLERCPVDLAVGEAARLLFVGGSHCEPPLEQRRGDVLVFPGEWLDTRKDIPDLTPDELGRLDGLKAQARAAAAPEAQRVRAEHRTATIQRRLPSMMSTGISASEAERRIGEACDAAFGDVLLGDFDLTAVRADGRQEVVTVAQVLSDRARWHEVDVLDPLNPGHRDGAADGRLYLHSASPIVFSLDDGGKVYRLRVQKVKVVSSAGGRSDVVQQLATVAAELDSVFRSDGGVVQLIDGRPVSLTKAHLLNLLGREVAFFKATGKGEVPADIGPDVAEQVLAELSIRSGLKVLAAVVDLPYPTRTGRVVGRAGYDEETKVYLDLDHEWNPQVPTRPTPEQVRVAVVQMMSPWRDYSFSSPDDAAGMVSSVLAACSRQVMSMCPAILLDAAQQGSGKTKAAMALCALVEGRLPAVTPYSAGGNDDEVRKWLLSCAVGHSRSVVLDNITGHVKSAALAGVLTSGRIAGRVLGESRTVDAAVRFLLTMTGNNASLDADMLRRSVRVRIDAGADPTHKAFAFDPVTEALRQRRRIALAACTIWAAYFAAGSPDIVKGDAGGFSDWNRLCRQPVLWLVREGLADGLPWQLSDPAGSMLADASYSDPEVEALGDLLHSLHEVHAGSPFLAAEVLALYKAGGVGSGEAVAGRVRSAVDDLMGGRQPNARTLGMMLKNRRDRPARGLKLLEGGMDRDGRKLWSVAALAAR